MTDTGSVYDMNIICPGDYMSSVGEGEMVGVGWIILIRSPSL
ncbi:WSSV037 [White spot syndrome virus]|uniref:WSSV037 n=1 Tax=White spot syndrome virus TaxID=342409 RepID=A0A2I6SBH5_9VIRU|nr:WSSV037 [White spot syndrome virus]